MDLAFAELFGALAWRSWRRSSPLTGHSTTAAWLLAPYLAWVSFAGFLNLTMWRLDPGSRPGLSRSTRGRLGPGAPPGPSRSASGRFPGGCASVAAKPWPVRAARVFVFRLVLPGMAKSQSVRRPGWMPPRRDAPVAMRAAGPAGRTATRRRGGPRAPGAHPSSGRKRHAEDHAYGYAPGRGRGDGGPGPGPSPYPIPGDAALVASAMQAAPKSIAGATIVAMGTASCARCGRGPTALPACRTIRPRPGPDPMCMDENASNGPGLDRPTGAARRQDRLHVHAGGRHRCQQHRPLCDKPGAEQCTGSRPGRT